MRWVGVFLGLFLLARPSGFLDGTSGKRFHLPSGLFSGAGVLSRKGEGDVCCLGVREGRAGGGGAWRGAAAGPMCSQHLRMPLSSGPVPPRGAGTICTVRRQRATEPNCKPWIGWKPLQAGGAAAPLGPALVVLPMSILQKIVGGFFVHFFYFYLFICKSPAAG